MSNGHEVYRFLHCNMRLKARYGIEMDLDEYREMNKTFKLRNVLGLRENQLGDYEGWLKVKGVWVCGHYKVREGFIATFMPVPPLEVMRDILAMRQETPHLDPEVLAKQVADSIGERRIKEEAKVRQKATLVASHHTHIETLIIAVRRWKKDVSWFKRKMGEAKLLLREGKAQEAYDLLDKEAGRAKNEHPGESAEQVLTTPGPGDVEHPNS